MHPWCLFLFIRSSHFPRGCSGFPMTTFFFKKELGERVPGFREWFGKWPLSGTLYLVESSCLYQLPGHFFPASFLLSSGWLLLCYWWLLGLGVACLPPILLVLLLGNALSSECGIINFTQTFAFFCILLTGSWKSCNSHCNWDHGSLPMLLSSQRFLGPA